MPFFFFFYINYDLVLYVTLSIVLRLFVDESHSNKSIHSIQR
jgi:hypothetical protein